MLDTYLLLSSLIR